MVNVPVTDHWYIAYHRFGIPDGDGTHRVTTIDKVTFGDDGFMQKITPTLTGVEAEVVQFGQKYIVGFSSLHRP